MSLFLSTAAWDLCSRFKHLWPGSSFEEMATQPPTTCHRKPHPSPVDLNVQSLPIFPAGCPCTTGGRQRTPHATGCRGPCVTLTLPAPGHAETRPEPSLPVSAPKVSLRGTQARQGPGEGRGRGLEKGLEGPTAEDGSLLRFGRNTQGSGSNGRLSTRAGEGLSAPFWSLAAPQRFGKK